MNSEELSKPLQHDVNVRPPQEMQRPLLMAVVTELKTIDSELAMNITLWGVAVAYLTAMNVRDLGHERAYKLVATPVEDMTIYELNVFVYFLRELRHQLAVIRKAEHL